MGHNAEDENRGFRSLPLLLLIHGVDIGSVRILWSFLRKTGNFLAQNRGFRSLPPIYGVDIRVLLQNLYGLYGLSQEKLATFV